MLLNKWIYNERPAATKKKITELRTALFFCESPDALPYAAYLVEVLKMDDQGFIWLYINKQSGHGVRCGELLPVSLEFYRKGVPYTIDIKGIASVEDNTKEDGLLLKIAIGKLTYKELVAVNNMQPLEAIGKVFKSLLYIQAPLDAYAAEV